MRRHRGEHRQALPPPRVSQSGHPTFVTPACLPALAQLASLQEVALDYPDSFTDTHIAWLMQHSRSARLKDYRESLSEYDEEYDEEQHWDEHFSMGVLMEAEGVDVYD